MMTKNESTSLYTEAAPAVSACFGEFQQQAEISSSETTRMGVYQFQLQPFRAAKGMVMEVEREGQHIISAHLPASFSRGVMRSASIHIRGAEYLLLAASSASRMLAHSKRWFAMFRADGKKIYATSLEQHVARVLPMEDGVSLLFMNGDSMRIKL
jgi:hypothetical protein